MSTGDDLACKYLMESEGGWGNTKLNQASNVFTFEFIESQIARLGAGDQRQPPDSHSCVRIGISAIIASGRFKEASILVKKLLSKIDSIDHTGVFSEDYCVMLMEIVRVGAIYGAADEFTISQMRTIVQVVKNLNDECFESMIGKRHFKELADFIDLPS